MSLLGAPLEEEEIAELRQLFPEFEGDIPEEARYWSRSDLELFLGSGGQLRPRETAKANMPTSSLLTRIRLQLADDNVSKASAEYRSFCKQLKEREEVHVLPGLAECALIPRSPKATDALRGPLLMSRPKGWCGAAWGMDFWKREYGEEWWKCRARSPLFEGDSDRRCGAAERLAVDGTVSEYVDYAQAVQKMDPGCEADNALAYPRVGFANWAPFAGTARSLFESCWRDLLPAGVADLSVRWIKLFAAVFNLDWLEFFARDFLITIGAAGTISRLHRENNAAHIWFSQIEGRRLFVLFSPQTVASGCLYEEDGGLCEGLEGWAAAASPVDIFYPSEKRHPKLAQAKAQVVVLRPGDTLVVPSGWWRYSVALEASVTLSHPFWNSRNRKHIIEDFREAFEESRMPPELQQMAAQNMKQLQEKIAEDSDSDMDF